MFRKPEIRNLDMSIRPEQQVFRLEISVDDIEGVEVVDSEGDFCGVEFGNGVWESL